MSKVLVQFNDPRDNLLGITPHGANITRTFVRNDIGTASITLPFSTPRLLEIIRWGNIIRIHESQTPVWTGVVVQRDWEAGSVVLSLKSAEWLMQKKLTRRNLAFSAGTGSGSIAYGLFRSAAQQNTFITNLRPGVFNTGTPRFKEPYSYADLYDEVKKLATEGGEDFWVDEQLRLNYVTQRGSNKTGEIVLYEHKHLTNLRVMESADDVITGGVALGSDSDPNKRDIVPLWWVNDSFARLEVLTFNDKNSADALRGPAEQSIRSRALPKMTVDTEFVKVDNTWMTFWLGDTVQLVLRSVPTAPQVNVTLIGAELSGEDKMRCVFEVVPNSVAIPLQGWSPS